ncbi:hypothetical protein I553_8884 [Mycobacterium xenopi 4042]|uniref:Uncharacterized protein n=1 Tax=Mycobacterium xenopi 4042 TaxID=1299334 RepID=X8CNL5_MYCXE|nr:hypothetical protein I553_8884 [Mycobacterium xenopi 4042]
MRPRTAKKLVDPDTVPVDLRRNKRVCPWSTSNCRALM